MYLFIGLILVFNLFNNSHKLKFYAVIVMYQRLKQNQNKLTPFHYCVALLELVPNVTKTVTDSK
jgi:hypothetical protein